MNFRIKEKCAIIEKTKITEDTFKIRYQFDSNFEWLPGQFVGITINPTYRRSYSIVDYDGENLTFLVDIKPGGLASNFFRDCKIGDQNQILGPYGKFTLRENENKKVFISTGTGSAPLIPMIKRLNDIKFGNQVEYFSGARTINDDFTASFLQTENITNFKLNRCITREDIGSEESTEKISYFSGRVTEALDRSNLDWSNTEFYICGNPEMVNDVEQLLKKKGADTIFLERY